MKNVIVMGSLLVCMAVVSGCASPGGMPIVGPFSAMYSSHADKAKMARSVMASPRVAADKKDAVIRAVNMSMAPGEIAAGYQVDILSLFGTDYTWGEVGIQALAATADIAAEAAAGITLYNTITRDSHDTKTKVEIVNNGDGNIQTINQGGTMSGSGSNTALDGAANGDVNVGP